MTRTDEGMLMLGWGNPTPIMRIVARRSVALLAALACALMISVVSSAPAHAAGDWSNNQTTVISRDHGLYLGQLEVAVWTMNQPGTVRAHVWGPGFNYYSAPEGVGPFRTFRAYFDVNQVFADQSKICAEGERMIDGEWVGQGLPCFTVVR
jgi:hypothetical protein